MSRSVKSLHRYKVASAGKTTDSTIQRFNDSTILISNRQRARKINSRLLKEIAGALLADLTIEEAELGINLVAAGEMTLVNETFLRHEGSTDVITFDYSEKVVQASRLHNKSRKREIRRRDACATLCGEIFICVDEAILQARKLAPLGIGNYPVSCPRRLAFARPRRPPYRRAPQDEARGKPPAGGAFQKV